MGGVRVFFSPAPSLCLAGRIGAEYCLAPKEESVSCVAECVRSQRVHLPLVLEIKLVLDLVELFHCDL
jgi:hypothetical protein